MKTTFKTIGENGSETYWNHNTAYHKWILLQIKGKNKVLDVGCGDGFLVYKLAKVCDQVIGIDIHTPSIKKAKQRLHNFKNTSVIATRFEDFEGEPESFDAIIFVASLHHMNLELCINKSIELLKSGGKLLIVGLAHPYSIFDNIIEIGRVLPAKLGGLFHNERADVGAPIADFKENLGDIRNIAKNKLPNAKIKQALYYRYLLSWVKPEKKNKALPLKKG
jgi:SAM-dependent methyltransferase